MKKVKLIPSLIMLVLFIGVLAIGVYALSPISNSLAGTISISAGKASLAITGYVDDAMVYPRTELHGGMDWTIDSSKLNFDASSYLFAEQVPSKEIKLVIENLSNVPYGVFFSDTAGVNATSSNIKTTGEVKSGTTTIVNASMDYYKYVSAADSTSTLDQVEMTITLSVANILTSAQTGSFKYYLNVEEYNSNLNSTEEFIKVDDNLTAIEASAYSNNTTVKNVIIPNTITSIGASAFSGCTGIEEITIPSSVTTIGAGVFDGCSGLQKIIVEAHAAAGNFDVSLPTISGFSWYLNGEHQTTLAYSTTRSIYVLGEMYVATHVTLTYEANVDIDEMGNISDGSKFSITGMGKHKLNSNATITVCITSPSMRYMLSLYSYNNSLDSWDLLCQDGSYADGELSVSYTLSVTEKSPTHFKVEYIPAPGGGGAD